MVNPIYYLYRLSTLQREVIEQNISFYKKLSEKEKYKFEYRVSKFIKKHNFVGRGNVRITPIVTAVVASMAVMITFKMKYYLYSQFKNIIIYPKDYLSTHTKRMHKGETNPKAKTIVFSWKGFVEGIKVEDDNLNLGIHEFTHALYFSFLKQTNYEANKFIRNTKKIISFLENKEEQKKMIAANYIREYAFENYHEFLAVITESYFETPKEFERKLPELFSLVNKLYKIY